MRKPQQPLIFLSAVAGLLISVIPQSVLAVGLARPACPSSPNTMHCHAQILSSNKEQTTASQTYSSGYTPLDLASAYKLPTLPSAGTTFKSNGRTVAIVDAYDNPNSAADMVAYRQQFKLPLCASSSSRPTATQLTSCFLTKLNQNGHSGPLPSANFGWGQEIDLDIQMVSAVCPNCKILLVEASSASMTNLGAAVNQAASLHANSISNSYGINEFSTENYDSHAGYYNHPGIAITASAGDEGYGVEFPAALQYVTAVGGTSLTKSSNTRGWSERAWNGGGSGCSSYASKPSWQSQLGNCTKRLVADVSAVADPRTGVAVYDSYQSTKGNWYTLGGTSVSSPIVAAVYALAGNAGGSNPSIRYSEYPYSHRSHFFDITSGSNGSCLSNLALCNAGPGFDGPTGLGSPNGILAF